LVSCSFAAEKVGNVPKAKKLLYLRPGANYEKGDCSDIAGYCAGGVCKVSISTDITTDTIAAWLMAIVILLSEQCQ
jgi:hypothetical protein